MLQEFVKSLNDYQVIGLAITVIFFLNAKVVLRESQVQKR